VRSYRAAPAKVALLAPALPASPSLWERTQELLLGLQSRLPGVGGSADAPVAQVAAGGGARGVGAAALAKLLAVCAGTVGGTAACVATGVAPVPADLSPSRVQAPRIERVSERVVETTAPAALLPTKEAVVAEAGALEPESSTLDDPEALEAAEAVPVESEGGEVEYPEPPPAAASPPPAGEAPSAVSASAGGEFGP
jgi:hypothetical protein